MYIDCGPPESKAEVSSSPLVSSTWINFGSASCCSSGSVSAGFTSLLCGTGARLMFSVTTMHPLAAQLRDREPYNAVQPGSPAKEGITVAFQTRLAGSKLGC